MALRPAWLPGWAWFILWVLIVVIVIILAALVIHALGGAGFSFKAGHFHFSIGVT